MDLSAKRLIAEYTAGIALVPLRSGHAGVPGFAWIPFLHKVVPCCSMSQPGGSTKKKIISKFRLRTDERVVSHESICTSIDGAAP